MATFNYNPQSYEMKIDKFYGTNESPDGDTGLKPGEANAMKNFRITAEGNLQVRPGLHTVLDVPVLIPPGGAPAEYTEPGPVRALWSGYVGGTLYKILVCGGNVITLSDTWNCTSIGAITDSPTTVFAFGDKVYFKNATEYTYWDGTTFGTVTGYRPLLAIGCAPASGTGTAMEQVNKLTGARRLQYTNTSSNTVFKLPVAASSVDYVKNTSTSTNYTLTTDYTVNAGKDTVTFVTAPATTTNLIEIGFTVSGSDSATVLGMKYFETFSGGTDAYVFLYGDGTNQVLYSGIEYDTGLPSAEYFPDLNVMHIDSANSPVTGMIRQGNNLVAYKKDSSYSISYDDLTLSDGSVTQAFYVTPINRDVGNEAYGQVKLIENYPLTLYKGAVWQWAYTTYRNEQNAVRISDRISKTLSSFDFSNSITYDDQFNSEYWIVYDGTAVIFNYRNNAWYKYTGINASAFFMLGNELYIGTTDGTIEHFSKSIRNDNGTAIDAYWEPGSYNFGSDIYTKKITRVNIALKADYNSKVSFKMLTDVDIESETEEIDVTYSFFSFSRLKFSSLSFNTNHRPRVEVLRYKAKKFVYGKIVLSLSDADATCTVTGISIPYIYSGKAR